MGTNYSTWLALFQAFDRAVIQPIRRLFPGTSSSLEGTPQIVNLDKECVEGPVPYHFGNARTKGTQRVEKAQQYQSTMTFQLTAVKKNVAKVEKPMKVVGMLMVTLRTLPLLRTKKKMQIWTSRSIRSYLFGWSYLCLDCILHSLYAIEKYGNEIETNCIKNLAISYIRAFP